MSFLGFRYGLDKYPRGDGKAAERDGRRERGAREGEDRDGNDETPDERGEITHPRAVLRGGEVADRTYREFVDRPGAQEGGNRRQRVGQKRDRRREHVPSRFFMVFGLVQHDCPHRDYDSA